MEDAILNSRKQTCNLLLASILLVRREIYSLGGVVQFEFWLCNGVTLMAVYGHGEKENDRS